MHLQDKNALWGGDRQGDDDLGWTMAKILGENTICFRMDEDFSILLAGEGLCGALGYTSEEVQNFCTLRRFLEEVPESFTAICNAFQDLDKRGDVTVPIPRKNASPAQIHVSGTVGGTDRGVPVCCASFTDITPEVCRREDLVRAYEERTQNFQWMMEEFAGNIYISDMDNYELLYLNPTSCKTLQAAPEELLGRKCYEVIQGRETPCPFCTNAYLSKDSFYEWEFFNPVLDRTFLIRNRIIDWNGRRARIELSHDMFSTEYKLAKKDRERESILRTIPGGFARLDARDYRTILWYGAEFLKVIGYTEEQFEGELHSQFSYVYPEDAARARAAMEEIRRTNKSTVLELRIHPHGGGTRLLTTTFCYVSGEDSWDGIPSFYSVSIDVTQERKEQTRQRRALEEAYQAARVASAAKTNFLSSMSHDIRTPMNAIMGMTAIAQANLSSPEKVHGCLNKIYLSSQHLLSLINEVLDMSKIESGKIDLAPENVDLSELVQNAVDMCRPLASEKKQMLQISVGLVHHEKVVADGDRLQQVFMNFLSNAVKYTPEGGAIGLQINELPSPYPQKGRYEFIFTDNGIGMSAEFLPHLFEPFARAEDPRISKIQGTGLGMAIAENIVRMMNGTIDVKSSPGAGSRFTVSLALDLQNCAEDVEKELFGLPVLVVDDEQVVCENAASLLKELGMRGYWVLSGAEAVARIRLAHQQEDDFFAVILDWKMPDMDGLDTLRAIRQTMGADVPIIIISAYDYADIEEDFIRAGADAFLTKPLFKSKMLHVLQLFCTDRALEEAASVTAPEVAPLLGKRLLLAEDNDLNREIAVELLQMQGIAVEAVENGRLAVEAFASSSPGYYAGILMDIQMPVMNGYEATRAIRRLDRPDARTIPILALTANAFATDAGLARSAGMNDHIAKPIDLHRLSEALRKWLA